MIQIKQLKKKYKDLMAVNDLSLTVNKGDIHGILGPNGAGKSTLIGCITGLVEIDGGKVVFDNKYTPKKWSKNIGYVPQDIAIYPELSPYENIRFFASLYNFRGDELHTRVMDAINFVGLMDVKDKKASEFSGGMKRRLNLACAIAHSPKLIIMDEPTVGIDPQSRNRILENVMALNKKGVTVIYTTHYMEEVESICNRITVMDHGKVIANGLKNEIIAMMSSTNEYMVSFDKESEKIHRFINGVKAISSVQSIELVPEKEETNPNYRSCMITSKNDNSLHHILNEANTHGLIIRGLNQEKANLETVFLELTGKSLRD